MTVDWGKLKCRLGLHRWFFSFFHYIRKCERCGVVDHYLLKGVRRGWARKWVRQEVPPCC